MKTLIIMLLLAALVSPAHLFAQKTDKTIPSLELDKSALITGQKVIAANDNNQSSDYKIISSNSSYIEIEFYPQYAKPSKVSYEGRDYLIIDFDNSVTKSFNESGQPDLKKRSFQVLLPSEVNNRVTVIDYDAHDVTGMNLAPVPYVKKKNTNSPAFTDYDYVYLRDSKAYSTNKFLPGEVATLEGTGPLRDVTLTSLSIYPYQYNPVTRQAKQYTRIRVRIDFGQTPVMINRPRSREEVNLLRGVALNSNNAINWMSPRLLNQKDHTVFNSLMASGDWYKIEIKDNGSGNSEGIYKLTKGFLEGAGINFSNVDPRTVKMYGSGGYMMPDDMTMDRPSDMVPIPIYIEGEGDGNFGAQDYILFYGRSVNNWNYDTISNTYKHFLNTYSNSNYYWICLNTPGNGFRLTPVPSDNVSNPIVPSYFTDKIFYEPEISNLIDEGTLWLSERKNPGESFNWNSTLTGLAANTDILYKVKPADRVMNVNWPSPCPYGVSFVIKDINTNAAEVSLPLGCVDPGFGDWIVTGSTSFTVNAGLKNPPNSEQTNLQATFTTGSPDGEGYIDWMEIQYKRRLNSAANDFLRFDAPNLKGTIEYNVSSFSSGDLKVFNVTNHNDVKLVQPLGINGGSVRFQKTQDTNSINKFIVTGPGGYKTPTSISQRIANQNLHGISDGADFIIITHEDFLPAANRLKAKRETGGPGNLNYLKTSIFTCSQIYNEFSSGVLDAVAIRDFLKYAYENWQIRPSYVLFLGDGDFDYKNILVNDGNWVPSYEVTDPAINQVNGYTSDDFYTNVVNDVAGRPDMGTGRIPAQTLADANNYLDKVDCYEDPVNNGYWKNKMVFVADDGYTSGGYDGDQHTAQCEELAENHTPEVIDRIKLYLIAYPTVITAQGRRKPGVNADIIKTWNAGCLNVHYTGHGSPEVWAHEYVLEKDVILSELNNKCLYPFVSIASCDMSKYDNPLSQCASELFVIKQNKGAIGTLAATRPVYGGVNAVLMQNFFNKLYMQRDTLLYPMRFGEAYFQTKQAIPSFSINDLKFAMLCDPTLRVAIPRFLTKIDSISGLSSDTMRALGRIKIYGSILHADSTFWPDYNGKTFVKVYDVTRNIEIDEVYQGNTYAYHFVLPGGIIFSGIAPVINGKWSAEYIVPKDISYLNQRGKIVNYFYNNQADGTNLYKNFFVGGINPDAPIDTTGPRISAFLNTRNFRTGDVVNENFKLIADMFDESGINTTGTIGHKIEATVDNDENHKFDLTNFYNSDTSYKAGSLTYDFTGIADGKHTLKLKAWDTYNNSSEATIDFDVVPSGGVMVTNVYNFPNPFKNGTAFTFQHNYPGLVSTKIKIYTVAGRLIKEIDMGQTSDKFVNIPWNGKDADGETLGNGIYIYKLVVTTDDGNTITNTGKLAVLK